MTFEKFETILVEYFNSYFYSLARKILNRSIPFYDRYLFPKILLLVRTPNHYIGELIGVNPLYTGLIVKKYKEDSIDKYFYQFSNQEEKKSSLNINGSFQNLTLAVNYQEELINKRFGSFYKNDRKMHFHNTMKPIGFGEHFLSCFFDNVTVINYDNNVHRIKNINFAIAINKNIDENIFKNSLSQYVSSHIIRFTNNILHFYSFPGLYIAKDKAISSLFLSGQFANVYFSDLRETLIGEFIKHHPQIILDSIGHNKLLYEPSFKWIEGNPNPQIQEINPDLMLQREDGFYDIVDLKNPKFDKSNITKGIPSRRRFIDYVDEAITQLANYERYFRFPKNQEYAFSKYGIQVKDPKLYLIVGNYENTSKKDVEDAAYKFNMLEEKYIILDYDTIYSLYINKA